MDCSTISLPVHHQLPEFTQTNVHRVGDAILSSVIPFSSCPQSFPESGCFHMRQFFASLFCCLAYRVIITIFLNSIYMHLYTVLVFLWLTSLCIIGSSFIHLIRTDSWVLFYSWIIFHCIYVPQLLYPFICQSTSRLLLGPSYCKQCCNEPWGTNVSFNSGFLSVYVPQRDCWVIRQFYF